MVGGSPAWNPQARLALVRTSSSCSSSPRRQTPKPSPRSALRSIRRGAGTVAKLTRWRRLGSYSRPGTVGYSRLARHALPNRFWPAHREDFWMLPTFVIGLREGLEAALIVGIIAAFLRKQGRRDLLRWVLVGVGAAIGLCLIVGVALDAYSRNLPQK